MKTNVSYFPAWMGEHPRDSTQWGLAEEKHLIDLFKCGSSLEHLTAIHGRNENAIESRLLRLIDTNFAKRKEAEQEKIKAIVKQRESEQKELMFNIQKRLDSAAQAEKEASDGEPFDLFKATAGNPIEAWMKGHWVKCNFFEFNEHNNTVGVELKGYRYNISRCNVRMTKPKGRLYILVCLYKKITDPDYIRTFNSSWELNNFVECNAILGNYIVKEIEL